ncbi:MAG TPA: hypothetical protein PLP27_08925 [Crocinitomicaceae bacterium]|nr:hypothetical protein [Crocinitomicaceae bacterium]
MKRFLLFVFCLLANVWATNAQTTSLREKTLHVKQGEEIQIDTLTIYPNTFKAFCGENQLTWEDYDLNLTKGTIRFLNPCNVEIRLEYRVFPTNFSETVKRRDTSLIFEEKKGLMEHYLTEATTNNYDLFGTTTLNKSGSISRGISFGNRQDMSVNSSMNLELSGELTPNLKVLASISDANIPIQADGNTNKLQEFDKIFIQLYNDNFKVIGGDFWLTRPKGYFLNYNKKAQGLYGEYKWLDNKENKWSVAGGGAFSRGKYNRQIIQGIEGNQGPYRLVGSENENFIIILSGTEQVFIDGRLLERGQELDYVINYNTAELTFTSRNLITKDKRIVVEFQYSDQNYARSLLQASAAYETKKVNVWFNVFSEQDAKNQTIQQTLSPEQKMYLSTIGDNLSEAYISSIDSVGFMENQNMYRLTDTLGYDSVLVYSVNQNVAVFSATFTFVGANQGDYKLTKYTALGKVYEWVAPINGVPQGDYQAKRVVVTPKKRQMVNAGASYKITKNLEISSEFAYTKNDLNTFSKLDSFDDNGFSNKTQIVGKFGLSKDSVDGGKRWILETKGEFEALHRDFQVIENYRSVEYDRDWNTRNRGYKGNQLNSNIHTNFINKRHGNFLLNGSQFSIGSDYTGVKGGLSGRWNQKGFNAFYEASYLKSKGIDVNTEFNRHKIDLSQTIKVVKIGVKDEFERNIFKDSLGLKSNSYQFFDYETYISNADTAKNSFKAFFRERYDQLTSQSALQKATHARNVGGEFAMNSVKNQRLNVILNYRQLKINDTLLTTQTPENTLLGRFDYEIRLFKNALTWNTFYEVGSGLEQRQLFQYIKVADGQGVYTWIDYNGDGVKDLNEFETAQYQDQASYIRVYVRSNEYTRTYSNEFNQTISINPDRIWNNKKGVKKFFSRFSDQARFRIYRKTNQLDKTSFNPFATEVRDTSLVSTNSTIRNSFYFNRTNPIFGAEYTFQDIRSKSLLASGFDARTNQSHEVNFHLNIKRKFTLEGLFQYGNKSVEADYTTGRNFDYDYYMVKPALSYQPSTAFRLTYETRVASKLNVTLEKAVIQEYGMKVKYNRSEKGSLQASFSYVKIKFNGNSNSSLGYEMLESLKAGNNFTWAVGYQHSVSKNLQLSIQYNARKTEGNKVIHTAGMEVRAFF